MSKITALVSLIMGLACILLLIGVSYQCIAQKLDDLRYAPPGAFVEVNGAKIHYLLTGKKRPLVVLDAGLGADSNWWQLVQKEVAHFATVCSFDRPGYGWSDAGKDPRTSAQIVSELHSLLHAISQPPYILVGHSFGGANMRLYANTYPDEVMGLILVDACHESQTFEDASTDRGMFASLKEYLFNSKLAHYLGLARFNMAQQLEPFFSPLMDQQLRDLIIAKASSVKALHARDNELRFLQESFTQLRNSKNRLLDKPLLIITAEETNADPVWSACQKELVVLSHLGKQIIAEKSSHMIHVDRPEIIVRAIQEMVELIEPQVLD